MTDVPGSAPAGNPAAAAADTNGAPQGGANTNTNTAWYSSVENAELRGIAELKGWDTPEKALLSYHNLEKLQGVPPERLLKMPEPGDTAGLAELHKKLGFGAPEAPTGYELAKLEGFDPNFLSAAESVFHKHGVPKDMAVGAMTEIGALLGDLEKQVEEARVNGHNADIEVLKREWGGNYDANIEMARRAAAEYQQRTGLSETDMDTLRDALGSAKFNRMWAGIGSTMGEAAFHSGEGAQPFNGVLTPDAAYARRNAMLNDADFLARLERGDQRAKMEWDRVSNTLAHAAANTGVVR